MKDYTPMRIDHHRLIKSPSDAVHYCFEECKSRGDGCACDCKVRIHFGIPPFGSKWPDARDGTDKRMKLDKLSRGIE